MFTFVFVRLFARSGSRDFFDQPTPSHTEAFCLRAAKWSRALAAMLALSISAWPLVSQAVVPASERNVLLAFYTTTNGAAWTTNTNWNGAAGTECTWFGVTCDPGQNNVIGISLVSNNLTGSLPATLNLLALLEDFTVEDNLLTGAMPAFTGMTALRFFNVGTNQLSGSIPALVGLSSLETFLAYSNALTGLVPALTGLSALQQFVVNNNQLSGLPALTGLTSLQTFEANTNVLTGSIPALTGLTTLATFDVGSNQLTGSIPALTGLTALQFFFVDNNQLTGLIPTLTGLTNLEAFRVGLNQLTGSVPAAPSLLEPGQSGLCPNQLTVTVDAAWDAATGLTPWSTNCASAPQSLVFGAAPILVPNGTGIVTITVMPSPGSTAPVVFFGATVGVCTVNPTTGAITVAPAAMPGMTCVITANKAGDTNYAAAQQVQLNIVIQAAAAAQPAAPVPTLNAWALLALFSLMAMLGGALTVRIRKVSGY
jgi:hypothetical protein